MQSNCRIMVPRFYTFEGLGQNTLIVNCCNALKHDCLGHYITLLELIPDALLAFFPDKFDSEI